MGDSLSRTCVLSLSIVPPGAPACFFSAGALGMPAGAPLPLLMMVGADARAPMEARAEDEAQLPSF